MWKVHVGAAEELVNALIGDVVDGGRIVLVGSRTMTGAAGKSQYTATKAAQLAMARSWAIELVDRAITVNVVAPGPTATPMLADPRRSVTPPRMPPFGRFIEPEEIAGTVALSEPRCPQHHRPGGRSMRGGFTMIINAHNTHICYGERTQRADAAGST